MSEENPVIDSEEELVETLGTTENETQEEETEGARSTENEDNAESENEEPSNGGRNH